MRKHRNEMENGTSLVEIWAIQSLSLFLWDSRTKTLLALSDKKITQKITLELSLRITLGLFNYYVRKIFRKTNIFYPLIPTRACAYQWVKNISFSDNFANVINEWYFSKNLKFFKAYITCSLTQCFTLSQKRVSLKTPH